MKMYLLRFYLRRKHPQYIHYIGSTEVLPAPLQEKEEMGLITRLGQGDMSVKAALIEHNLRLVVYIAKKFENTGINIEDLVSIGTIGLIKAVNTFEPSKNIKLATYASRCIENEILMYLRRNLKNRVEISLDEPLNVDWDGNELLLSDVLGTEGDMIYKKIESEVEKNLLHQAMHKLSNREKTIIQLRFGLGDVAEKTQKEVADILGISQSYISRLEKRILKRLQREIRKIE
ncbi:RNA polymerase sporulation sigma factor SigE [Syntrophomonas palmitatica]|uniref:RNA polymerase sporulation sigma factor SigE n=1 Tax=Syntrophomonas palmitatica TaxID=402877 RepID=UPI001A9A466F|nr:RNA polymerase sporulation sigma factor SigE [Syntrophomonas palmitatica]